MESKDVILIAYDASSVVCYMFIMEDKSTQYVAIPLSKTTMLNYR